MFKYISVIIVGVLLGAINNPAHSQTQEETIIEIIEATQMLDQFKEMRNLLPQIMEQQMNLSGTKMSPERLAITNEVAQEMFSEMEDDMMVITIRLYQDHFTQEELEDLLVFYRSDTGMKLNKKAPEMMAQVLSQTNALVMELMPKMQQELKRRFEELEPDTTS